MKDRFIRIGKMYTFSASHFLPNVEDGHPCKRLHGHNYKVEIEARGKIDEKMGWMMDFYELDKTMKPIIEILDHHHLNDVLNNPTAEELAHWILDKYPVKILYKVRVWETDKCYAEAVNTEGFWAKELRW